MIFGVLLAVPIVVIILLLFEDKEQLNKEDEEFNISEIVAKSASKIRKRIPNKKNMMRWSRFGFIMCLKWWKKGFWIFIVNY